MKSAQGLSRSTLEQCRRELERRRCALLANVRGEPEEDGGARPNLIDSRAGTPPAQPSQAGLLEIDRALAAIVDGTYGTCTACGEPIGFLRLTAVPQTRLCLLCAYP